jgi:hypothetical protein
VVSRIATGLGGRGRERPVCPAALGGGGCMVVLGGGGSVVVLGGGLVLDGCSSRVSARWRPLTPGETAIAPANTRTAIAAAATTAAPMTTTPTTQALCIESTGDPVAGPT